MCEHSSVLSLLYDALAKTKSDDSIVYRSPLEKEALIIAIEKAIMCAKNVTKG